MTVNPRGNTLRVGDMEVWYKVTGSGPPLVVQSPGWGFGSAFYQQTLNPLEGHFTLLYYDTPGSGQSAAPRQEDIQVGTFVEVLEALRHHLHLEAFALLGHSHGGFIAMNYALKYPQSLSHLVLVGAQLGVEEPEQDLERTLPTLAQDPRFAEAAQVFMYWRQGKIQLSGASLGVGLDMIAPLYFFDPVGDGVTVYREYVRSHPIPLSTFVAAGASDKRFLVREKLGSISVPTLIIEGRHDFICSPVQAQAIQEGIRGSRLVIFERSGHYPWLEEPEVFFTTLTDFLAKA
ncbi:MULTISPECIES: alpha/beta fold hydrolase [unclassified Meiothermus]|uniref:alpha/beta fold hydrolase n=1 Tax=unclassified Meiothermus TaxID=370471 RepID=UPI000D7BFE12|nr:MULTISPECIES: alpha/beta fold hydrolase [unclassified Meiothermus]PZA06843.1 prolyl aminopeptidase [Meiothermus sp. Pnk-1]RYM33166.1 alpha/beta fold hydrolase [Meiothermus sp. PNK-Is4]